MCVRVRRTHRGDHRTPRNTTRSLAEDGMTDVVSPAHAMPVAAGPPPSPQAPHPPRPVGPKAEINSYGGKGASSGPAAAQGLAVGAICALPPAVISPSFPPCCVLLLLPSGACRPSLRPVSARRGPLPLSASAGAAGRVPGVPARPRGARLVLRAGRSACLRAVLRRFPRPALPARRRLLVSWGARGAPPAARALRAAFHSARALRASVGRPRGFAPPPPRWAFCPAAWPRLRFGFAGGRGWGPAGPLRGLAPAGWRRAAARLPAYPAWQKKRLKKTILVFLLPTRGAPTVWYAPPAPF